MVENIMTVSILNQAISLLSSMNHLFIAFRVSCRRREMYIGLAHLRVSACPSPHSHTTARTRM